MKKGEFLFNPDLPFTIPDFDGNRLINGRFVNDDEGMPVGFRTALKWLFSSNPQRAEKKAERFQLPVKKDNLIFENGSDAFSWLGHAAFIFRLNNKRFLTDPCLFSLPGTKRHVSSPYSFEQLKQTDVVLFTHTHRDHYDVKSVRQLLHVNPDLLFYVPLKMGKLLRSIGAKNIIEAGWYQQFPEIGNIRIDFLPARHWNRRFTHDTNRELWGSFMIHRNEKKIYFAGDTSMGTHFSSLASAYSSIDHVFLPIAAYKPHYMMKDAHISPQEAIEAFHILNGTTFIPKHYGTFDLSDEPMGEPIRIIREAYQQGTLKNNLLVPAVGETILLD
jgi:L-ascorbate metabolism protein UlaG (beta-lactamase superfamily)